MNSLRAAGWITFYLAIALSPLIVALFVGAPPGNGFRWDFAIALGIGALGLMATMPLLTGRFRRAVAPFGIDIIFYFHRLIGLVIVGAVLLHALLLLDLEPLLWHDLKPGGNSALQVGTGALIALILLVGSSIARKIFHLPYDIWRKLHVLLAITALALSVTHVACVNYIFSTTILRYLLIGLALLWAALMIYMRVIRPVLLWRRPYRVESVVAERGRAWTLTLVPSGHSGFNFQPGQFAWLTIGHSPWAMQEHPFSIASSAEKFGAEKFCANKFGEQKNIHQTETQQAGRIAFTIKELGDFTSTVGKIVSGQTAFVDGPYGAFSPDRHDTAGLVLIAGGIGIAPIMSMLRTFADRGDQRSITLFYAYRNLENLTFREELESLAVQLKLKWVIVLAEPPTNWPPKDRPAERGLLTSEMITRHLPVDCQHCQYYICGPQPMLDVVETALQKSRISLDRMHFEFFDMV